MIKVKCFKDDVGNEFLPYFDETEYYQKYDEYCLTKHQRNVITLYNAIVKKENYWYLNKPTAFGNPDYSLYHGIVLGMLSALDWDMEEKDDWITVKNGRRTLMKIQKPKKSQGYWDAKRENAELLTRLGL